MGSEWYDLIAKRNGGYKSKAVFSREGVSGEDVFTSRLKNYLILYPKALDAGCGHGEYTLSMAPYAKSIVGFDFSSEMIRIAKELKVDSKCTNVEFEQATTKNELPFSDNQFDMIYDRRGPTSILEHGRILRSGGIVFGIHSGSMDIVRERLKNNHFVDIELEEFEALCIFNDEFEFMRFMSDMPGNPNYALPEYRSEFEELLVKFKVSNQIRYPEWRYIWKAIKP